MLQQPWPLFITYLYQQVSPSINSSCFFKESVISSLLSTFPRLIEEDVALAEKDQKHSYYLDQAYFISQSIKKIIEKIIISSIHPPIIVIISDHGKFPIGVSGKGKKTLPLNELSWRLSNFIALYLPSESIELPEIVTPINVLRLLLRNYFGYNIPLLENSCHTDFFDLEKSEPTASLLPFQYDLVNTQP